jgi:prevent-host-death family protein
MARLELDARNDYDAAMAAIKLDELAAHLDEHIDAVERGAEITVVQHDRPIVTIAPYQRREGLQIRRPAPDAPALRDIKFPEPLDLDVDIVDLLLKERQNDR